HLREQSVDQPLLGLEIEHPCPLNLITAGHADGWRHLPHELGARREPCEVEARSNLLLERARDEGVRSRVEYLRFPERTDRAVLGKSKSVARRIGMETDARKQADRAVLPKEIPTRNLERRSRRELELLRRHSP